MTRNLRNYLSRVLSPQDMACVHNSYDIIGDIAIIPFPETPEGHCREIAEAIMDFHKNVKTVLAQTSPVHGGFRIRGLEYVAGRRKSVTTHTEAGCTFVVDVEKCYFSPRLSYERMRIAKQINYGEVVLNMFAGVGCFSLQIARHSSPSRIYSIDLNPVAFQYMRENVRVNGAFGKVIPILGDAKEIVERKFRRSANRVLMPLPERALEYLPYALMALSGSTGWVHYYAFEHTRKEEASPVEKAKSRVTKKLKNENVTFEIPFGRIVRTTGPNWYQVVLDIAVRHLN